MSVKTIIGVSGMTCSACSNSIELQLSKIDGVETVSVSLMTEEAVINHLNSVSINDLIEAIADAGFKPTLISSIHGQDSRSTLLTSESSVLSNNSTNTSIFQISGMTCAACSNSITNSLKSLNGVHFVDVSLLTGEGTVTHDTVLSADSIAEEIEDIGFDAKVLSSKTNNGDPKVQKYQTELTVSGMTCSSCVNTVTSMLKSVPGVEKVSVSLLAEKAVVIHDSNSPVDGLKEIIEDCGFDAQVLNVEPLNTTEQDTDISTVHLKIYGMTSDDDATNIERDINSLDGVIACVITFSSSEAEVKFDNNIVGIRPIIIKIENCGCDAFVDSKMNITSQLDLLAKVKEVRFWKSNFMKLLIFGIPVIFLAHFFPKLQESFKWDVIEIYHVSITIWIQLVLGTYIQLVLGKMFYINSYKSLSHGTGNMDVLICTSTTIVYVYSVIDIVSASFTGSDAKVMFDTSVMLFIFVSLGKWIESRAKGNTSTALSQLLSLSPRSCIIVANPEIFDSFEGECIEPVQIEQQTLSVDLLQKNDIVIILPGSKIPADGICIFGSSETNESLLTGESLPVRKEVGSKLIGGSVNLNSTMYMKVETLGEHTQLQQIVKLIKDAQFTKAPIQRIADYIASIFVPTILFLSFITLVFWFIYVSFNDIDSIPKMFLSPDNQFQFTRVLQVAISVIVVACPCALGLAAPTAIMVGTGVGASHGILIKGGDILEQASKIDTVIFDKTGTVTNGQMTVTKIEFTTKYSEQEQFIWSILHSIEQNSEHPIAMAIVKSAEMRLSELHLSLLNNKINSVTTHSGLGISIECQLENDDNSMKIIVGNEKFMNQQIISNSEEYKLTLKKVELDNKISSISHILINDEYAGFLELSDTLKPDSCNVIQNLIKNGFSVGMVTGDSAATSEHVAKLLGIPLSNVLAEATPEQKLEYIQDLQVKRGLKVAFVGDGINDAPALVKSDVGIAISTGTSIAMSAADIVLLTSGSEAQHGTGLKGVIAGLDISKRTFTTIKLNFLLAIIYNISMIPMAMGVLIIPYGITLHPMVASACMALSSISVICNSLSLKLWNFKQFETNIKSDAGSEWRISEADISSVRASITDANVDDFCIGHQQIQGKGIFHRVKSSFRRLFDNSRSDSYEELVM